MYVELHRYLLVAVDPHAFWSHLPFANDVVNVNVFPLTSGCSPDRAWDGMREAFQMFDNGNTGRW